MIKIGIVRGLKNINAHIDAEEARHNSSADFTPTKWFKLADKQAVKVVFLQELDPDSENYSEKNNLGFLAVEHSNPDNYKRKAVCTMDDEGACWACEQHRKDWKKGWKTRTRLYVNVLVDDGQNDPYVAVLSQGLSASQITPTLIEYSGEDGAISDKWFNIKRSGAGFNDTSYTLRAGKEHGLKVEDYELFDLENVVRQIPYAEQEAHYLGGETSTSEGESGASATGTEGSKSANEEW